MRNDSTTYEMTLLRPHEVVRDFELSCNGITVIFRPGFQNGYAMLARRLREAGMAQIDGSVNVAEIGVKKSTSLRQSLPSLFTLADLPAERVAASLAGDDNDDQDEIRMGAGAYDVLTKLLRDSSIWPHIQRQTRGFLTSNGLVVVTDDVAAVTELGRKLHSEYEPGDFITTRQRAALNLTPMAEGEWTEKVHGKTRNYILRHDWVYTEDGVVHARSDAEIRALIENPVIKEIKADPKPEPIRVPRLTNIKWLQLLRKINDSKMTHAEWEEIHGKTRNTMIRDRLVILNDGRPELTSDALLVLNHHQKA